MGSVRGLLGVYVDDLLLTAEPELLEGLLGAITSMWKCSTPQALDQDVVFCGLQIQQVDKGYTLGQSKYVRELQQRHADIRESRALPSFRDEEPDGGVPLLEDVREAQRYLGELQWLACRSRPDISFSVSRASRLVARNPRYAIKAARQILAYLFHTVDFKLKYGNLETHIDMAPELPYERNIGLVEAFSDASFGCEDGKSQSGVAVLLGGCLVAWLSIPQPFTTLSTCEAELVSACEGLTLSQAIIPLWQELIEVPTKWVAITDSVSAAAVLLYPSGSWRTRHLRLRCRAYQELIEEEVLTLAHVKGQFQVADLLTKALSPQRIRQLVDYLGCVGGENKEHALSTEAGSRAGSAGSQAPSVTKALAVLSCLLSPVEAQPTGGPSLLEAVSWCHVVVCSLVLLVVCVFGIRGERSKKLERLRSLAITEGQESFEPWELAEIDAPGISSSSASGLGVSESIDGVAIPSARSTVGVPPPLSGPPKSGVKSARFKPSPILAKPPPSSAKGMVQLPGTGDVLSRVFSVPVPFKGKPKAPPSKIAPSKAVTGVEVLPGDIPVARPPVKRPPLLPRGRFYGLPPKANSGPEGSKAPPPELPSEEDTVVRTPPRQASTELPPLLSYVELVQRAMRRELQREPTAVEVEEEIRQMGIRHARAARSEGSSDSYSDDISTDTSSGGEVQAHVAGDASASSQFEYLPPDPVPVVRLIAPREERDQAGGVIWDAVRVESGRETPTVVVANERASGSEDQPSSSLQWASGNSLPVESSHGSQEDQWEAAQQREHNAFVSSGALTVGVEEEIALSSSEAESGIDIGGTSIVDDVDYQIASATLLLQQHTSFQVPSDLNHLTEEQREIYDRLVASWREALAEVD